MDSAVENALKRREEIRAELNDIERFLRLYERFKPKSSFQQQALELHGTIVQQKPEKAEQTESVAAGEMLYDQPESASVAPKRGWTREMLKPHLRKAILEAGRPLTRTELVRAMDERRIPVGGTDRAKNMGTMMWRLNDDFVSLEGLGYWPRNEPYQPAGYDPTDMNSPHAIAHTLGLRGPLGGGPEGEIEEATVE